MILRILIFVFISLSSIGFASDYKEPYKSNQLILGSGAVAVWSVGTGEKSLSVNVSPYGVFGSSTEGSDAFYWPVGKTSASGTVFESGIYFSKFGFLHEGGIQGATLPGISFESSTSTSGISQFDINGFHFKLEQTLLPTDVGARLDQIYTITNNNAIVESFDMIRHVDGDLYFDGTLLDTGAKGLIGNLFSLYEFDAGDNPDSPTTYVGITVEGGDPDTAYRIASYRFTDDILASGIAALSNVIDGDTNGDGITNSNYDITMSMGKRFTNVQPGATKVFKTSTYWGKSSITSNITIDNIKVIQVVDTDNLLLAANKDTVVRVNMNTGINGLPAFLKGKLTVDGTTQIDAEYGGDACFQAYQQNYYADIFNSRTDWNADSKGDKYKNAKNAMNFFITNNDVIKPDILSPGNHSFSLQLSQCNSDCQNCTSITPSGTASLPNVVFKEMQPIIIYLAPIRVRKSNACTVNCAVSPATEALGDAAVTHVRAVYPSDIVAVKPLPEFEFQLTTNDFNIDDPGQTKLLKKLYDHAKDFIVAEQCSTSCSGQSIYERAVCKMCTLFSGINQGIIIAGVLGDQVCLAGSNICSVGGYTNNISNIPVTIQKQQLRSSGKYDVSPTLSHELGHTKPFCLDDEYDNASATWRRRIPVLNIPIYVCGGSTRYNPVKNPLRGNASSSGDDLSNQGVNFLNSQIVYNQEIYQNGNLFGFVDRIVSSTTLKDGSSSPNDWTQNDSFNIFNASDVDPAEPLGSRPNLGRHGNFVTYGQNAFNPQEKKPVFWSPDEDVYGFMSNADLRNITTWATSDEYRRMFNASAIEAVQRGMALATLTSRNVVIVSGTIKSDDTVSLDPLRFVQTDQALPSEATGNYAVVIYDAIGSEITRKLFSVAFEKFTDTGVMETNEAIFSVTLEYPANAHAVKILKISTPSAAHGTSAPGDVVLAGIVKPSIIPAVSITRPLGGEVWNDDENINWVGSNGALYYTIQFSNDDGQRFMTLVSNLYCVTGTCSYRVKFSRISGGRYCKIKVIGSDGFNAIETVSNTFTVGDKYPGVSILSPANGSIVTAGIPLLLKANAVDFEDGVMGGNNINWQSSINGSLGTGGSLSFIPLKGTHIITVTATDSQAQSSQSSITITAGDANQIPMANAGPFKTVFSGYPVILDGSSSKDPNLDPLTYTWSQVSGQAVTLNNIHAVNPQFIAPNVSAETVLVFRLTVNDGTQDGIPSEVRITVRPVQSETAILSVTTTPINGAIYVDGEFKANGSWNGYVTVASHTVSFGSVVGYSTPSTQTVSVNPGQTTNVTGTYIQLAPTITVTYPTSGSILTRGRNYTITWTSSNVTGNVQIDLYKGSSIYQTLAVSDPNDGSYPYTPPSSFPEGSDYRICVSAMSGTASNCGGYFTITPDTKLSRGVALNQTMTAAIQQGTWQYYYIDLPGGSKNLVIDLYDLTSDLDLIVRQSSKPTINIHDCGSWNAGAHPDQCTFSSPTSGRWWIGVNNWDTGTISYTIKVTWKIASPPGLMLLLEN
jgi:hypothetical protein